MSRRVTVPPFAAPFNRANDFPSATVRCTAPQLYVSGSRFASAITILSSGKICITCGDEWVKPRS